METNDLGDKKINNEQEVNEGFSGENLPENYNPSLGKLKPEEEIDQEAITKQYKGQPIVTNKLTATGMKMKA